jgi:membrane-bound lytic murein transglycosylase D
MVKLLFPIKSKKIGFLLLFLGLFFFPVIGNAIAANDSISFAAADVNTNQINTDGTISAIENNIDLPKPESEPNSTPIDNTNEEATQATPIESSNIYNNQQGNMWDEIPYYFQIPDYSQRPEVAAQILWFQKHQKYFDHVIEMSIPYIYYVYEQARKRNMPPELVFLPIIESAYNSFAYSNKGAYGFWQMMPGTAAVLGLKINWWYDGRSDLVASTNAAFDFLTDLSTQFNNDWLLSIAAYNCGPGAVQKAIDYNIRMGLPTDYWSLHLPKETKNYVPTFLAIEAIVRTPGHYGLTLRPINNAPYLSAVKLHSQIDLKQIAKMAGVSEATLRKLNPGLKRWATNPEATYSLLLPINNVEEFKKNLAKLSSEDQITWRIHKVAPGETIKKLAVKYNTTPDTLLKVNHLQSSEIHSQQRLLIPINAQSTENITIPNKLAQPKTTASNEKHKIIYHVKSKDTLAKVANKYGVTQKQIRSWNNLKPKQKLKAQQKLIIWIPTSTTTDKKSSANTANTRYINHKVAPKETVYHIATLYGVPLTTIEQINHIKNHSIRIGQILKIPA